jgi:hypothetical protein
VVLRRDAGSFGNDLLGRLRLRNLRAALLLEDADPFEEDLVGLSIREGS